MKTTTLYITPEYSVVLNFSEKNKKVTQFVTRYAKAFHSQAMNFGKTLEKNHINFISWNQKKDVYSYVMGNNIFKVHVTKRTSTSFEARVEWYA